MPCRSCGDSLPDVNYHPRNARKYPRIKYTVPATYPIDNLPATSLDFWADDPFYPAYISAEESIGVEYMPATYPTPADAEAARDAKVNELLKKLQDGFSHITEGTMFRDYLITASKFWDYSFNNTMLILIQRPGATRCMGFNQWKELGRFVKKGEKGIGILAPRGTSYIRRSIFDKYRGEGFVNISDIPRWEQDELRRLTGPQMNAMKITVQGNQFIADPIARQATNQFMVVYVFDVSQTEGKPLPEFHVQSLTNDFSQAVFDRVIAVAQGEGLTVDLTSHPEYDPDMKGFYQEAKKLIWIRPEEPKAQQEKTLFHELAHYWTAGVMHLPRADAETIAESAAFVVAAHYGFDTGQYSFPYVAIWAKDEKVLKKNIKDIVLVSKTMLEKFGEISRAPVTGGTPFQADNETYYPYHPDLIASVVTAVITSADDIEELYRRGIITKREVISLLKYRDQLKKPFTVKEWQDMRRQKAAEHGGKEFVRSLPQTEENPVKVDFLADSPDFIASTVPIEQFEQAFTEAIARARNKK